jgi:hypothetical protein
LGWPVSKARRVFFIMIGVDEKFYNTISTSRSSTNKPKKTISKLPRHIGIDKLHIHIPLYSDNTDGSSGIWKKKKYSYTPTGQEIQKFEGFLEVTPRTVIHISIFNYGTVAEITFNPSRVIDSTGSSLCPLEHLKVSVRWVLKQLEEVITPDWCIDKQTGEILDVWPFDWYSRVIAKRIDLAVDISSSAAFNVNTVRQQVSIKHKYIETFENRGICNTLVWGKNPWIRETFYNKGNCPEHKESDDIYRFEVQMHRSFINKNGWQNLEIIKASHIMNFMQERWDKSGLGIAFTLNSNFAEFYNQLLNLMAPSKAMNFLGAAFVASQGLPININNRTVKDYRKLGETLGFSFGSDISKMSTELVYLDFKMGKMRPYKNK